MIEAFKCLRCGHAWLPRPSRTRGELPKVCPSCKSAVWHRLKQGKPETPSEPKPEGAKV